MSQEPNPKDFYNRTDYAPSPAQGPTDNHSGSKKPDDVLPPPPYSPTSSSVAGSGFPQQPTTTYGTISTPDHQTYTMPSPSSSSNRLEVPSSNSASGSTATRSPKGNVGATKPNNNDNINNNNNNRNRNPLLSLFKDKKIQRTCFKKSLKFLLAVLLLGFGTWKYIDYTRPSPPPPPPPPPSPSPSPSPPPSQPGDGGGLTCQGLDAVLWNDLPRHLEFEKEIRIRNALGREPSSGMITVYQSLESRRDGKMEVQVKMSKSISPDTLSYTFEDSQLTFQFPAIDNGTECVELTMDIWVPERAKVLVVDVPSVSIQAGSPLTRMDLVDLHGSTIQFQGYEGKELRLNAQGSIEIDGPVETREPVQVTSQKGSVLIKDSVLSKNSINIQTSDGQIEAISRILADDSIVLRTDNGPIVISDTIQAERVQVEASNGPIRISSVGETANLMVQSSNGNLDIGSIRSEKDAEVQLITNNGLVAAHMTHEYEGTLSITTSIDNVVNVMDPGDDIHLVTDKPYMKQGTRLDGDGRLTVTTSNADAEVYFDV